MSEQIPPIRTGQAKATHKWLRSGRRWVVGSVVAAASPRAAVVREYHTGELSVVETSHLSVYPESPIHEPEVRGYDR